MDYQDIQEKYHRVMGKIDIKCQDLIGDFEKELKQTKDIEIEYELKYKMLCISMLRSIAKQTTERKI
jgi:hypothetical protein